MPLAHSASGPRILLEAKQRGPRLSCWKFSGSLTAQVSQRENLKPPQGGHHERVTGAQCHVGRSRRGLNSAQRVLRTTSTGTQRPRHAAVCREGQPRLPCPRTAPPPPSRLPARLRDKPGVQQGHPEGDAGFPRAREWEGWGDLWAEQGRAVTEGPSPPARHRNRSLPGAVQRLASGPVMVPASLPARPGP